MRISRSEDAGEPAAFMAAKKPIATFEEALATLFVAVHEARLDMAVVKRLEKNLSRNFHFRVPLATVSSGLVCLRMSHDQSSAALLADGKQLSKDGKLDDAVEILARSVEARMNEEGTEISGGLAEFLIEYADALLCKEEANSTEILAPTGAGGAESEDEEGTIPRLDSGRMDAPLAEEDEEEILTDLQLAWESFEHARLCLLTKPDDEQRKKDLSFVHCRLGDIQALQDQFSASIADYAESIEYGVSAHMPARKVAGLIVSLCQTFQVFMTSDEIKADQFNEIEFVEKFKALFSMVAQRYDLPSLPASGNGVALVARDGFRLSVALMNKTQSSESATDLSSTIAELQACADDCMQQQSEIASAKSVVPGVTMAGFARPSGNEASSSIITVAVKRKVVSGETQERSVPDAHVTEEPTAKRAKETKDERSDQQRAEKAKLVD